MLDRSPSEARRARVPFASLFVLAIGLVGGLAACGNGGSVSSTGSASTTGSDASQGGSAAGGTGGAGGSTTASAQGGAGGTGAAAASGGQGGSAGNTCAHGWFATGVDAENKLVCAPFAPPAREAITNSCAVYLGWKDGCTGCGNPPDKWGTVSTKGCTNGAGVNDTCTTPTLDGKTVQLFGLDFDGDVNGDDKIYLGLYCPAGDATVTPGPCATGSFATTVAGGAVMCVPAAAAALDHVRTKCGLYFGWRDACDGCTSAPDRWGAVSPTGCTLGSGDTNTCTTASLGGKDVQLFGLNVGGNVDGNDKLYLALHCGEAEMGTTMTKETCPPGQLITAMAEDGTVTCESPAKAAAEYFEDHCTAYLGWRDACNGCTDPPDKWGRVRHGLCTNDNGVDNTCAKTVLAGETLPMFGLNTDGDVNDDDKLYVGFRCE